MNRLTSVTLTQFRNYGQAEFAFLKNITCISGPNGSGKTALLDAVYYLCYTKSYFSSQQQHSVKYGTDGFRISGKFDGHTIVVKWKGGKKEVLQDDVAYERIADHIGQFAAVMIAPDDMELINDGSEYRRKWMDSILGQTDRAYLENLLLYTRVLQQRNAWLKMQAVQPDSSSHTLDYYNAELSRSADYIYTCRSAFLDGFQPILTQFYHLLSSGREVVRITYNSDLHQRSMHDWLQASLQQDLRMQRSTRGIHKDDLLLHLEDSPLREYGSQGQKKSFLFAMKLAQYAYISTELKHLPLLLLDDIFEKLDQNRMEALLRIIQGPTFGQVLLTDTHAARVQAAFGEDVEIGLIALPEMPPQTILAANL